MPFNRSSHITDKPTGSLTYSSKEAIREAAIAHAAIETWVDPLGLTVSFKRFCPNFGPVDEIQASASLSALRSLWDQWAYGNKKRKCSAYKVRTFVVLENVDRLHAHLIIEPPRHLPRGFFVSALPYWCSRIQTLLPGFKGTWARNKIDPVIDDGFVRYITKHRSKSEYSTAIDWINCHLEPIPEQLPNLSGFAFAAYRPKVRLQLALFKMENFIRDNNIRTIKPSEKILPNELHLHEEVIDEDVAKD